VKGKVFASRYEIRERLGVGGMAEVYSAWDNRLNRKVAIKILHPSYAQEPGFVARFRREAQAAANLNHPNIVNIYDWGAENSTYFIVMEHLAGKTLKQLINDRAPFSDKEIIRISLQVASALGYAHQQGTIHRDIKPDNIIVSPEGNIKVTDFGIARSTTATVTQTQTGSILGSAHYLSPEQAQGNQVGAVSDLYSLGIVMYEMATGKVPFEGENPVTVALKQVHQAPLPPTQFNANLGSNLENVIVKLISKNPADRYQSSAELDEDLQRCLKGKSIPLTQAGGEETVLIPNISAQKPQVKDVMPPAPDSIPLGTKRRRRWPIILAIIAFLILSGVVAALAYYLTTSNTTVPKVVGKSVKKAKLMLEKKKLKLKIEKRAYSSSVSPGIVISQNPSAGLKVKTNSLVKLVVSRGKKKIAVPNLIGISSDRANYTLAKVGLEVGQITRQYSSKAASGYVISQTPAPGEKLYKGDSVDLIVSKGARPIKAPDLVNKTFAEAQAIVGGYGLSITKTEEYSSNVEEGRIIRQNPAAGATVERGATISVVVSKGVEKVSVPDVYGMTSSEAKAKLEGDGFVVVTKNSISSSEMYGKVVNQDIEAGKSVKKGSTITIYVGIAPPDMGSGD
jgi:serine/threonine-protein kinase